MYCCVEIFILLISSLLGLGLKDKIWFNTFLRIQDFIVLASAGPTFLDTISKNFIIFFMF